jgi:hypothetical protein
MSFPSHKLAAAAAISAVTMSFVYLEVATARSGRGVVRSVVVPAVDIGSSCVALLATVVVALWCIRMIASLPFDLRERRWRARMLTGCCWRCGYDLRASASVCPECGRPVTEVPCMMSDWPSWRGVRVFLAILMVTVVLCVLVHLVAQR